MKKRKLYLALLSVGFVVAALWLQVHGSSDLGTEASETTSSVIRLWEPLVSDTYAPYEKIALCANVVIALAGLLYALLLVGQVMRADQGTSRMQEIARAVREGANAYLYRQFRVVGVLIVVITGLLYMTAISSGAVTWSRRPFLT
jgi:K(+)-stimulated pyrophosphate-energized sodium pump